MAMSIKTLPFFLWAASTSSRNWSSGVAFLSNSAREGSTAVKSSAA